MAKQAKKLPKLVRTPDVTFETPVFADPLGSGEVSALFVVVFGKAAGAARASVLGRGQLVKNELVLAEAETVEALRQGATPTSVGIAWLTGSTPHTEAHGVQAFGPRKGVVASDADMWMIELDEPSLAPPTSSLPPGASPASGWCVLFPWLSMCHKN